MRDLDLIPRRAALDSWRSFKPPLALADYDSLCRLFRAKIIELCSSAKTPHLASAYSCVEIVAALYGGILKIDPKNPYDTGRDRFIFSKGHAATTLYTALTLFGFFEQDILDSFGQSGSSLAEQPIPWCQPGVEVATGSLGHGLPIGLGMALAAKLNNVNYRVFVLLSDGECNEGSVWEAAMSAPVKGLDNIAVIVDYNKWQATGRTEEIMAMNPLNKKWEAFGWDTYEVDGHNIEQILNALSRLPNGSGKPVAVVAHTVKGKGVSFMEDDNNWHYRIATNEDVIAAKRELLVV